MPDNWIKIFWVTLISVVGSVAVTCALAVLFDTQSWSLAVSAAILCPLLLAPPVTYVCDKQGRRVEQLLAELQIAHEQLSERARRDALTGLLDRSAFMSEGEQMAASGLPNALLLLDADHFKSINDRYGHIAGDSALIAIASVMKKAVDGNGCAGRVGGEEFAILVPNANLERMLAIAEAIRAGVAALEIRAADGARIPLTVSIGAVAGRSSASLVELYSEADRRLYAAKRNGRNRVVSTIKAPLAAA